MAALFVPGAPAGLGDEQRPSRGRGGNGKEPAACIRSGLEKGCRPGSAFSVGAGGGCLQGELGDDLGLLP